MTIDLKPIEDRADVYAFARREQGSEEDPADPRQRARLVAVRKRGKAQARSRLMRQQCTLCSRQR